MPRRSPLATFRLFWCVIFLAAAAGSGGAGFQGLQKTCDARVGSAQVTEDEVMEGRYPDASGYHLSDACLRALQSRVERWRAEDRSNWDKLSNQACSYALGWMERVPGTCTAGGPPPICPVDHWYRDPARAKAQRDAERARVRAERAQELNGMACSCEARAITTSASTSTATSSDTGAPRQAFRSLISIPCAGTCTLPGYSCVDGFCQLSSGLAVMSQGNGRPNYLTAADTPGLVNRVTAALQALNRPVLPAGFTYGRSTTVDAPWLSSYRTTSASAQLHLSDLQTSLATLERLSKAGLDTTAAITDARDKRLQLRSDLAMLTQSAGEITRQDMVPAPGCSAVFQAEQGILAESAATILGQEISADAWPRPGGGYPQDYAFILADYSCGANHERVRYLSQVFGFCGADMKAEQIISDNQLFFAQVTKVSCPVPSGQITAYLVRERTPALAEQTRARAARETGFRIVPWTASVAIPMRSCR